MKLLVAGSARVDAGKTTFSAGLIDSIEDAVGFKPRAGNDYWFDHDDVQRSIGEGRLYGKDVHTLTAVSATPEPEELQNPVHRLWRPTPDRRGLLGENGRTFLVDRVRTADGDRFIMNGDAEDAGLVPDAVYESLPLSNAPRVRSIPEFNELMAELYVPAFDRVESQINETDPVVVESYGDIATPVQSIDFDAVAVVEPTRARIYAGDRYEAARSVASGSAQEGQLEERVDRVLEFIEPLSVHELPALTSSMRADPEAIATAYEDAYSGLLTAAQS